MGKRDKYRDCIDPEEKRWGRKYAKFPGVAECVRLICARKARGSWIDIIIGELARNASHCHPELIETFRTEPRASVFVIMALEIACLPESIPFFAEVLNEGDPRFTPYANRALEAIDTPESRKALWEAANQ